MTELNDHAIRDRLIALTRDLVLIPSIPSQPDDRRRCYEFVKNHLDTVDAVRVHEYESGGNPSMVALPDGCSRPDILMCAHLDVITHPDIGFYRSEIRNGRIIGPGAGDMKGALAIVMEVFCRIQHSHPGASLGLAVTSDEETGGMHGIGYLFEEHGLRCGIAMIPDGGSLNDITVDEKGILHLRAYCRGKAAHAARPWLGDNPINRLLAGLERLQASFDARKLPDTHWFPTCSITGLGTENESINRVPADAWALLDVRFPQPHTTETMLAEVRDLLGPQVDVQLVIGAEATHLSPDPLYREVTEAVTGKPVQIVQDCGGSDSRFITHYDIPVLMSRPLVGNLHAHDEWIDIESMVQFYKIYGRYIREKLKLDIESPSI